MIVTSISCCVTQDRPSTWRISSEQWRDAGRHQQSCTRICFVFNEERAHRKLDKRLCEVPSFFGCMTSTKHADDMNSLICLLPSCRRSVSELAWEQESDYLSRYRINIERNDVLWRVVEKEVLIRVYEDLDFWHPKTNTRLMLKLVSKGMIRLSLDIEYVE